MLVILVLSALLQMCCCVADDLDIVPGQCVSRYDYEYKVVKQLVDLETRLDTLQKKMKDCQDKQSVAFMAQLSANMLNPLPDTTVKFGSVVTNVGKGYDPDSGFFVAKVAGTYNFHLHAGSPRKEIESLLQLHMMKNTEQVGYVWLDGNKDRWLGRSASIVLHLHPGDKVYVKIARTHKNVSLAGCCYHTHFNGFLIQPDNN